MAWTSPTTANLADFFAFCFQQGVPSADLPQATIAVVDGGSGYVTAPSVTVDAPVNPGLAMTATATISGGVVTAITVTNPGTNYASLPGVTIGAPPSGGTQATAQVTALASPFPAQVLNSSLLRTINDSAGAPILGELSSYVMAVYNLAFHILLIFAPDQSGQTFFGSARKTYDLSNMRPGIIMAAGDQGTSQTMIVPQFFQHITLEALEATKTPWGRYWVEYQQMYGQTIWGFT